MKMTIGMKTIVDSWNLHVMLSEYSSFYINLIYSYLQKSMQIEDFYESMNHGTFELVIHIVIQQYSRKCIFSHLHNFLLFNNEI